MGAYWYMLRSPKLVRSVKVERPDNSIETVKVAIFSYLCKPYWHSMFESEPKWMRAYKMQIARMEQIWTGKERPQFGVTVSNLNNKLNELPPKMRNQIKVGDTVEYFYHPSTVNTPPIQMSPVVPVMFVDEADGRATYGKIVEIL